MDAPTELKAVLAENRTFTLVEDSIYSVLPDISCQHHYDRRATVYDLLVSTRLYNSVMWGSTPRDYIAFVRQAVTSCVEGRFLDAACGSLLFTAPVYLETNRHVIAFDQSIVMLRRARKRLLKLAGSMPQHIVLLQADLSDLPFLPANFRTVLCMNVLHHYADATALIPNLDRLLTINGHLFLTSLVANNRFIGDRYLNALYSSGEFVRPRSSLELRDVLTKSLNRKVSCRVEGNMAFVTTMS